MLSGQQCRRIKNTGARISDVSAWVLGLGLKGGEGIRDLGPEAGLLGDGGEDGPDARLSLLDRLVGELARHRAHLVGRDGGLGRRGHAAGGLIPGLRRRLRHLGRVRDLDGRVRRHCARAGAADPASARRGGRERVAGGNGRASERPEGTGTGGWGPEELVSGDRRRQGEWKGCGGVRGVGLPSSWRGRV